MYAAHLIDRDTTGITMGDDRIQRTTYDDLSRPIRIVGAYNIPSINSGQGNVEIELGYTPNGQVDWRRDGNGNLTDYRYDSYDRLDRTTFPDASYEGLTYNSRSLVTQRRTRSARLINHAWDGAGRLTATTYPSYAAGETPVEYTYDGQGREVRIERASLDPDDDSVVTIAYDDLGRRASETQQSGSGPARTVEWQYDIAGRPIRQTWPDGFHVTYAHTAAGQLRTIRENGAALLAVYDYDSFGRPRGLERGNGRDTAYSYDPVSRVSRLNHVGLLYTDFTYNPASQIRTRRLSNTLWAWDGDANYDRDYAVNALNQYESAGPVGYDYDANGNMSHATGPGSGAGSANTYIYDPQNRLLRSAGGPDGTITLRYDGRGRLRQRAGAGTTTYLYAGDALIAEYGSSGVMHRRYVHGPGVDEPLVWYEGSDTSDRRYLLADERGSITTVTNDTGGIIARNTYDDWGNPGATNMGRFQYTGQQWLPEIRLYNYKSRFYNPLPGRFMQTDPIGYEDGMNLYAYTGNDPMNSWDPNGRQSESIMDRRYIYRHLSEQQIERIERLHYQIGESAATGMAIGAALMAPGPEDVLLARWAGSIAVRSIALGRISARIAGGDQLVLYSSRAIPQPREGEVMLNVPNFAWSRDFNASVIREAINIGRPIRDSFVRNNGSLRAAPRGSTLGNERRQLREAGWQYNRGTREWEPPERDPCPASRLASDMC